jgi:hypothetical protein
VAELQLGKWESQQHNLLRFCSLLQSLGRLHFGRLFELGCGQGNRGEQSQDFIHDDLLLYCPRSKQRQLNEYRLTSAGTYLM